MTTQPLIRTASLFCALGLLGLLAHERLDSRGNGGDTQYKHAPSPSNAVPPVLDRHWRDSEGHEQAQNSSANGRQSANLRAVPTKTEVPPEVEDSWWFTVHRRMRDGQYQLKSTSAGLRLVNPSDGTQMVMANDGSVTLSARSSGVVRTHGNLDAEFTLRTKGVGDGKSHEGVCSPDGRVDVHGDCLRRAEADHGNILAWWDNSENGLRQGWTVAAPMGDDAELRIEVEVAGAEVALTKDGIGLGRSGEGLEGTHLRAWDADGQALPVYAELTEDGYALVADVRGAAWPVNVDPTWVQWDWRVTGDDTRRYMGHSVTRGDFNCDGFPDAAVGALFDSRGGAVLVFNGSDQGLAETSSVELTGSQAGEYFGNSIAGDGDVNGDGCDDLVVGAPRYGSATSFNFQGAAAVYYGSSSGLSTTAVQTWYGGQEGGFMGGKVAMAGDVNGDGYDDVLVSSTSFNAYAGQVWLFLGASNGISSVAHRTWSGVESFRKFGDGIAGVGDVNGDGYDDIAIGTTYHRDEFGNDGKVEVYLGSDSGPAATTDVILSGSGAYRLFGSVIGSGDIDGNGFTDVIVGAPYEGPLGPDGSGMAFVFLGSSSGLPSAADVTLHAGVDNHSFGSSVDAKGDFTGDGVDDLLVGANCFHGTGACAGRVYLYEGNNQGRLEKPRLLFDGWSWRIGALGSSLAYLGDVNGDGFDDFVAGSPRHRAIASTGPGAAMLYLGSNELPASLDVSSISLGADTNYYLNAAPAGAGDVNGDGYADILVGDPGFPDGLEPEVGRALLYLGGAEGPELDVTQEWLGTSPYGHFGWAVTSAGDLDGDGHADMAIGEPHFDERVTGTRQYGGVHVYLGSSGGSTSTAHTTWRTTQGNAELGLTLAGGTDINGDGHDDLVVGSPRCRNNSNVEVGCIDVHRGSSSGISEQSSRTIWGAQSRGNFGGSLDVAGDVNADGYGDIIVGSHEFDIEDSTGAGRAMVFHGTPAGLSSVASTIFDGTDSIVHAGYSVAGLGDVDGDGYDDVAVSYPDEDARTGYVRVYRGGIGGVSNSAYAELSPHNYNRTGMYMGGVGDINGDDLNDLLIMLPINGWPATSADDDSSVVIAFYGSETAISSDPDWRGAPWMTTNDEEGVKIDGAGDVNGDGYDDFLMEIAGLPGGDGSKVILLMYGSIAGPSLDIPHTGPIIAPLADISVDEGSPVTLTGSAADSGGNVLTYRWDFGDGFDTTEGQSVSHSWGDDGEYLVVLTVDNGVGGVSKETFVLTVHNVPPVVTNEPPVDALEGTLYRWTPTVIDPGEDVLTFTLVAGPEGAALDSERGTVEWTPSAAQASRGYADFLVSVSDDEGGEDRLAWTVTVRWLDEDEDGLSDAWEEEHGLDPTDPSDALADGDGDGRDNLTEYADGTDPMTHEGPRVPVPLQPVQGEEVGTAYPLLSFQPGEHPLAVEESYEIRVYEDVALSIESTGVAGLTDSEWRVDVELLEDATLYWRVRATDEYTSSAWSPVAAFKVNVVQSVPTVPVPTFPIEGQIAATIPVNLQWIASTDLDGDAITYDVELRDEMGGLVAAGGVDDGGEAMVSYAFDGILVEDALYVWKVRAMDEHGNRSNWSEQAWFRFSSANGAPEGFAILEPRDGDVLLTTTPDVVLAEATDPEGGVVTHELELDMVETFDGEALIKVSMQGEGSGTLTWNPTDDGLELEERADWFARARAKDEVGVASPWDIVSFHVGQLEAAPGVPELLSPENGADVTVDDEVTFMALAPEDPNGDEVSIEFVLSRTRRLAGIIATEDGIVPLQGEATWRTVAPDSEGTLWWTARAEDTTGRVGDWATPRRLEIQAPSDRGRDTPTEPSGRSSGGGCSSIGRPPQAWMMLLAVTILLRRKES